MIPLPLDAVADVVGGDLVSYPADVDTRVTGVSIDSRTTMPGDLFVPLVGEQADGHRYVADALQRGAAGFLCDEANASLGEAHRGCILVDDPLDALTGLGAWVRDEVAPVVVAITGSNGKTTTKDLAAAAIGAEKVVVANPGSFNNEIGLPLTLCLLTPETEVLVCEIGARGIGHIAAVMPMLRPDVAIVTTVSGAHLGEFGSLQAVWEAKGELVEGLGPDGVAILNADLDGVAAHVALAPGRVLTFGLGPDADLHPDAMQIGPDGRATIALGEVHLTLPVPGRHHVGNALAALAAAQVVGVPLDVAAEGLAAAAVSRWRMEVRTSAAGVVVVNDAYNANPQSTKGALDTVAAMATDGRRWAVLGYMAELGPKEGHMHAGVGAHAADARLEGLIVVDRRAHGIAEGARQAGFAGEVVEVPDAVAATAAITARARSGDLVLVKASRSVGLEAVAAALLTDTGGREARGGSGGGAR